ncbi:hypothetical protein [Paracoccus versutus]|uniref:Uncharacterized protein n=1 Tax=Paracoccus versutus TaxID=34007 RepID=A0A3D9XPI2_PARVE|nr:hypothetical protein [Paracoccus versutus]REF72344.1 hypothetical protein BDD41_0814 [Paracoccus versutus]WGR55677.1 hypothetical protein E3U25_06775 [Paracoccus versutus]
MSEAMDKLIAAVERGDLTIDGAPALSLEMSGIVHGALGDDLWATCVDAFDGSLDAALSLMQCLLPTGQSLIGTHTPRAHVSLNDGFAITCFSDTPARAWLIAILKAYRTAQREA